MAEANSWLDDRKPLLTAEDHGKDESSTAALLQRHLRLEKEVGAYAAEMKRLSEQARSAAQLTALTVSSSPRGQSRDTLDQGPQTQSTWGPLEAVLRF